MVLGRALAWTAERHPERIAVAGRRPLTYAEWDARTNRLAGALGEIGVGRGDRMALVTANSEPMASAHLAAQKLGAASVPLNVRYAPDELAYCLADAQPKVLLSDDTTVEVVGQALERLPESDRPVLVHDGEILPDGARVLEALIADRSAGPLQVETSSEDTSVMLYTAGTTGRPKGVPRSNHAEVSAGLAHIIQARYGPFESTLCAMPRRCSRS